ncbi:MAG TPA: RNA polymerase sigma factor [Rhizomicrobium sp.]|nr:RNA polymerase sigma factor [Rhizomicrobium sp.]
MADTTDIERGCANRREPGAAMSTSALQDWFVREVLPLEAALMQFLRRSSRNRSEADDLRQEVYVRICEAAQNEIPVPARPFVFTVARNLLIDRARREQIVSIEAVADLGALEIVADEPEPDRSVIARQQLRRLQSALDRLPGRCRQAVILRKIDGLSYREIATRMGIAEDTVSKHLREGMYVLADALHSEISETSGGS